MKAFLLSMLLFIFSQNVLAGKVFWVTSTRSPSQELDIFEDKVSKINEEKERYLVLFLEHAAFYKLTKPLQNKEIIEALQKALNEDRKIKVYINPSNADIIGVELAR